MRLWQILGLYVLFALSGLALSGLALDWFLTQILFPPMMLVDPNTEKCVHITPEDAGTCDNPPARYEKVYTSP